jgi:hypothetical protein
MKHLLTFNESISGLSVGDIIINHGIDQNGNPLNLDYPCEIIEIKPSSVCVQNVRKSKDGTDSIQWYTIDNKFYKQFDCGDKRFLNFINKPTSNYGKIKSYYDYKNRLGEIRDKRVNYKLYETFEKT